VLQNPEAISRLRSVCCACSPTSIVSFQIPLIPSRENIVKSGTFLYDGTVLCDVCIAYSPIRCGTGDYEDEPDVANDLEIDSYYVWFGSTTERGQFNAGGGAYSSLEGAIASVETDPNFGSSVMWID
jgi:hypothetical protein